MGKYKFQINDIVYIFGHYLRITKIEDKFTYQYEVYDYTMKHGDGYKKHTLDKYGEYITKWTEAWELLHG